MLLNFNLEKFFNRVVKASRRLLIEQWKKVEDLKITKQNLK